MSAILDIFHLFLHRISQLTRYYRLRLLILITKSTQNQNILFLFRKIVATTIITTFITLIVIICLRLLGSNFLRNSNLPQIAAHNPNLVSPNLIHRYLKIGLYSLIFLITFRANFYLKPVGNVVLFFGVVFYWTYFAVLTITFLKNLPKEIEINKNYPYPALSHINYFHHQLYCNSKNNQLLYLCEPSLICTSRYYDCLYGCQARCQPKVPNPMASPDGKFKIVQYNSP